MKKTIQFTLLLSALLASHSGLSEPFDNFVPVTDAMLADPDPNDWLMYSRTYDAQRFSPLDQINRSNVSELEIAWTTALPDGVIEIIPIVYDGVMYLQVPAGQGDAGGVVALDATTGEQLWHYRPEGRPVSTRAKTLSIYEDMILVAQPARGSELRSVVALDAVTGELRWEIPVTSENHTSGTLVADGKVFTGRTCNVSRENCPIVAHDARTGEELWRFHTTPGAGEPGDESWGGTPANERRASTWGLPGTYDAERGILFWGISNPMPNTRADRHGGDPRAIPETAPSDLYSNSTVALDPDTGELLWYYQHLPGDDWDMDINHEKMLISTVIEPSPDAVKWINPNIARGEEREVVVTSGEGGGLWVNDRETGEFIWAMPFPFDTPNFIISDIDVDTGIARINWDAVLIEPGARRTICYWNQRNFWPTAYHPELNSLYIPYFDYCLDMTRSSPDGGREIRTGTRRPGGDPEKFAGIAKIDMRTGEILRFNEGGIGGNGSALTTAGGLLFWGDIAQVFHAFDAESGEELWRSDPLGTTIMTSTITYAVDGRQYIAVIMGNDATGPPAAHAEYGGFELPEQHGNALQVFALPD